MSFGEFAPAIFGSLLKYLPFFNKFRVPSMILTMVQINAVILAALGLSTIIDKPKPKIKGFQTGSSVVSGSAVPSLSPS